MATNVRSSGHRISSTSSLLMLCSVLKPISGRNSPKASSAATAALLSAPATSARATARGSSAISDFLHVGPAEDALRQEDQRDGEDRERRNVLVVDREIGRPEGL